MRRWPVALLVTGMIVIGAGFAYDWLSKEEWFIGRQVGNVSDREMHLRRLTRPAEAEPGGVSVLEPGRVSVPSRSYSSQAAPSFGPLPQTATEPPPSEEQQLYNQLTGSLRTAQYAFNHPDVMYLARHSQITLTLAADAGGALDALRQQFAQQPEGAVTAGETKYSPMMEATLRGRDFKIDPPGPQQRTVLLSKVGPTEWTWIVEPLETGASKLLVVELFARLARGNDNLPPLLIKTFEAHIKVDVQPFDRILIQARRMTPIAQAFTGVGGLIAVIGFIGTARRWLKRVKPSPPQSVDLSGKTSATSPD